MAMVKNVFLGLIILALLGETGYIMMTKEKNTTEEKMEVKAAVTPTRPPLVILTKGMKLSSSPISKFAYEIAPTMSENAKDALVGWNVTSKLNTDGTTTVSLTPKDSDDQNQQYFLSKAQVLYFVEMTRGDDKSDSDKDLNYRDDYGIVTDASGTVQ